MYNITKNIYKNLFIFIFIILISLVIMIYIKNMLLYHPNPAIDEKYSRFYKKIYHIAGSQKNISHILVETVDKISLDSIFIKNPTKSKCIIYFHGNSGNISMRFDMIKFLYNYASVIIFDYRSFGKSTGNNNGLSARALEKDADAIWQYVVDQLSYSPNKISLFGESLGCSIAINLAAKLSKTMNQTQYPHSLILNSPFYSLADMIENTFDKINIGFIGKCLATLIAVEYKSNEYIKYLNHQTKIIIAHSPRDEIIPYHQGLNLYNSICQYHKYARFINLNGTHNNLGLTDRYIYTLADIFD